MSQLFFLSSYFTFFLDTIFFDFRIDKRLRRVAHRRISARKKLWKNIIYEQKTENISLKMLCELMEDLWWCAGSAPNCQWCAMTAGDGCRVEIVRWCEKLLRFRRVNRTKMTTIPYKILHWYWISPIRRPQTLFFLEESNESFYSQRWWKNPTNHSSASNNNYK